MKIKKLLVPVDLSGHSGYALEMTIAIAEKFKAEIVIYHAIDIPILFWEMKRIHVHSKITKIR